MHQMYCYRLEYSHHCRIRTVCLGKWSAVKHMQFVVMQNHQNSMLNHVSLTNILYSVLICQYMSIIILIVHVWIMCYFSIDAKDVEDVPQTFPDLEQRLQVYSTTILVHTVASHCIQHTLLYCWQSSKRVERQSIEEMAMILNPQCWRISLCAF